MKLRSKLEVFATAMRLGFKQVLSEWLSLLGGFLMYSTLIIAYAGVFRWIPTEDLTTRQLTLQQLIWYIGTTEFVLFCGSFVHFKELQYEIQTDQIHLSLLRPCPVWVVRLGEWSGQYVGRFVALVLPSFTLVYFTADQQGLTLSAALGIMLSLPMAGLIMLLWNFIIGVSCVWLMQAEPAFWIWQKCLFLFGALLWPLALYPSLMGKLVWLTPFPAILSVVGGWVISNDLTTHIGGFLHQIFWLTAFIALVAAINRAVLRHIQRSGE